ncbi:hypothetical protein [Roseibium marinum]|uniref:Uncharacterized protein n=1 Tax=Roseibium marinum TaxID=281252 RepID=A0A2S3UY22_9HYPH|nr:hypothetical protein [Roseibium marinum]POF32607.1 hypothetical protein CLV41_1029 [Roseibium marinum]
MTRTTKQNLSGLRAIYYAFVARDIEYFPRLSSDKGVQTLASDKIIEEIQQKTKNLPQEFSGNRLDEALKLGRESLDEVKEITEYQDQKATRLLIITSFLSALSGMLFSRFAQAYQVPNSIYVFDISALLIASGYLIFLLFVLSAISGALVIFHATRTRFKFPNADPSKPETQLQAPRSQLFFPAIISVRPSAWAESFFDPSPKSLDTSLTENIGAKYLRNYIAETYLVAAKTADKVRYLEPAQNILAFSLRCLLVWLILLGFIHAFIAPTSHLSSQSPVSERAVPIQASENTLPKLPTATLDHNVNGSDSAETLEGDQ